MDRILDDVDPDRAGVTVTPYVNSQRRCTDKCRARRAESMTAPHTPAGGEKQQAQPTTSNVYTHVFDPVKLGTASKLDGALLKLPKG